MATKYSDIVTAINARSPSLANNNEYLSTPRIIPFFLDASELLLNDTDVVELTKALPFGTKALSISFGTDGSNGAASSSTAIIKAGSTVITTEAKLPTSVDNAGALITYTLKNTDVSGQIITLTVDDADWQDTVDMYGYITLAMSI